MEGDEIAMEAYFALDSFLGFPVSRKGLVGTAFIDISQKTHRGGVCFLRSYVHPKHRLAVVRWRFCTRLLQRAAHARSRVCETGVAA